MGKLNAQILAMAPDHSKNIIAKAKAKKDDPSYINLSIGEPDFATPKKIVDELYKWASQGYTHYTVGLGLPELRERIAKKLKEENNCHYTADQIVVTPGAKFAIYAIIRALVDQGAEVMYLTPVWLSYSSIIEISNGVPVPVHLNYDDGYKVTLKALEAKVTDKTRALMINYPNNPTGKCLTPEDYKAIKTFLLNHPDIYLVSDEIYERITYDGHAAYSPASDPELANRVITVNGFSKAFAMTGWRLGYLAAPPEIIELIDWLNDNIMTCVSGFLMKAALFALDCQDETENMRKVFEQRRNLFINGLNSIPGVEAIMPEGAFYAWVRITKEGIKDSVNLTDFVLNKAHIISMPGIAYGEDAFPCVRMSYAAATEDLQKAVEQLRKAMKA